MHRRKDYEVCGPKYSGKVIAMCKSKFQAKKASKARNCWIIIEYVHIYPGKRAGMSDGWVGREIRPLAYDRPIDRFTRRKTK